MIGALHQGHASDSITLEVNRVDGAMETVRISRIDLEAPWRWLNAGWSDLMAVPQVGLLYGAVFAVISVGLWWGLSSMGWQSAMLALAGGFMLVGPILAVGLYEVSRQRALGLQPKFSEVVFAGARSLDQLALLGLGLVLLFMIWVELAFLLFMMFFGDRPFPPLDDFIPRLLLTWDGVTLLVVGTIVGACLAAVVFSFSVISAPMLISRPVGVSSAVFASLNVILLNFKTMALWALLIAGFMAVGIATLSIGLIVLFPLIGHASWHAYKETVEVVDEVARPT